MKVLVLGSSGIIGSHMRITPHPGLTATYHTGRAACDLTDEAETKSLLAYARPDVVVNLAGESRPDVVEKDPYLHLEINVGLPRRLGRWASTHGAHLVHVSSQAVFSGAVATYTAESGKPFGPSSWCQPINKYGWQKLDGEQNVRCFPDNVTIVRPTFVLGIRPDPTVGRPNPVELMLAGQKQQVNDRWFSPSFAPDVASLIWDVCRRRPSGEVIHAGVPIRTTRYEIAEALGCQGVQAVSHEDFPGIAPRPRDTTYAEGSVYGMDFEEGIADCLARWKQREKVAA